MAGRRLYGERYEDDESELDVRIRRSGRVSPAYPPEASYRVSRPPVSVYERANALYVPNMSAGIRRSLSTGGRTPPPPPAAPAPQPVIINNHISEHRSRHDSELYDSDSYSEDEREYYALAPARRRRSHSRSRPHSQSFSARPQQGFAPPPPQGYAPPQQQIQIRPERDHRSEWELERTRRELEEYRDLHSREEYELERQRRELEKIRLSSTKDDYELERTKKELAAYKANIEKAEEEKRIKAEMEYARLKEERKKEEEKARLKKENEAAIEKYKAEQEKKAKEAKEEKEKSEKELQRKLEETLRNSGMDEREVQRVLKKDAPGNQLVDQNRPTYTRMSRRHLSIETLNKYRIDYEFDQDPEYILIKRWVPEYEQDFLWSHTRQIREARRVTTFEDLRRPFLVIEDKKPSKHHSHETDFELVRTVKKKHERKPSPSPLLTFLAGGKPR